MCDLIAKFFCYHFTSEWRNGKQLFQRHQYSLMRCWKICKRKWMLSQDNTYLKPTRKTVQQINSYWSTTAKPNQSSRSHALKLYLLNFTSWKECLMADQKSRCTLQGVQKGRQKSQYHLSDWKLQSRLQFVAVFKSARCFNRSLICVSGIGMNGLVFQAL